MAVTAPETIRQPLKLKPSAGSAKRFTVSPAFAAYVSAQALPLPSEQAFAFDAIASDGNTLLLRFSPAPGYYLYRDRTSVKLDGSTGVLADKLRWPAAQSVWRSRKGRWIRPSR